MTRRPSHFGIHEKHTRWWLICVVSVIGLTLQVHAGQKLKRSSQVAQTSVGDAVCSLFAGSQTEVYATVCSLFAGSQTEVCATVCSLFAGSQTEVCATVAQGFGKIAQTKSNPAQHPEASTQREVASLLQAGRFDEAETIARQAVAANPRDAHARALLGLVLDQRGRTAEAEDAYRQALRIEPKSAFALTNLGVLLVRKGKSEEGLKFFEVQRLYCPSIEKHLCS